MRDTLGPARKNLKLCEVNTSWAFGGIDKEESLRRLAENVEEIKKSQEMLYAQSQYGLLVILQGMDTSGKDGVVKAVMAGLNPVACDAFGFKAPSPKELRWDFMRRAHALVPARGEIVIFARSYYEEVVIIRIHEQLLARQNLPESCLGKDIWKRRYEDIRNFENYLANNGIGVIKFFLHISKEEQRKRLLERVENKTKNWKFSPYDLEEREYWDEYQETYEEAIKATSTDVSPWYVVPADKKWSARLAVSEMVRHHLMLLPLRYPHLESGEHTEYMRRLKKDLEEEKK